MVSCVSWSYIYFAEFEEANLCAFSSEANQYIEALELLLETSVQISALLLLDYVILTVDKSSGLLFPQAQNSYFAIASVAAYFTRLFKRYILDEV